MKEMMTDTKTDSEMGVELNDPAFTESDFQKRLNAAMPW